MPGPYSEEPGIGESVACWVDAGSSLCRSWRNARYAAEQDAARHEVLMAAEAEAAIQAQRGYSDARNQAQFNQAVAGLAVVGPVVLLVVGSIGGYLWWRRQQRAPVSGLEQYSDVDLERMLIARTT
jgi:hypothetical protein